VSVCCRAIEISAASMRPPALMSSREFEEVTGGIGCADQRMLGRAGTLAVQRIFAAASPTLNSVKERGSHGALRSQPSAINLGWESWKPSQGLAFDDDQV
jgi:hypothetical protein